MAAIHVVLGLAMMGVVSIWVVSPVLVVCYVRGALLTHELMHVRRPERVAWTVRMMMLFDTPLGLGYREYQDIHLRHHRDPATVTDPEFHQIKGGRIRAFLAAMVASEVAVVRWVATRGIGPSLRAEACIRAFFMLTLAALAPAVFLRYWIILRLTIGVSNYMFHHVLHYRNRRERANRGRDRLGHGEYGTFPLRLPWPLDAGLRVVLGSRLAPVLCDHDAHHAWPGVKAGRLPGLLSVYPSKDKSPEVPRC